MVSTRNRLPPSPSHGRGAKSHGHLPKTQERRGRELTKKAEAIRGPAEFHLCPTPSPGSESLVAEPPLRHLIETTILFRIDFSLSHDVLTFSYNCGWLLALPLLLGNRSSLSLGP